MRPDRGASAPVEPPATEVEERPEERRTTFAIGVLLVVVGVGFLIARQLGLDVTDAGWPLFVIVPGLVLFALAFVVGGRAGSGFAVAGGITTVTGLILAVQNATDLWATWAYAWALVAPGGVGLGMLIYGALTGQRDIALSGGWALLVGFALFVAFAFLFEAVIGISGERIAGLDVLLAAGLVVLGVVIVAFGLFGGRRRAG
jgi:hypothetical protein